MTPLRCKWPTLLALSVVGAVACPQLAGAQVAGAQAASVQPAPAPVAATANEADLLAVIGSGPATLRVTRADFDRAFRLAVGEVLNRQGLPLRDDLLP
ncbi:MAG: hypothetical protein Q4C67_09500, partial [Deinococcus sp.]|nr:hypothetical protein [Deinococcus sp.]